MNEAAKGKRLLIVHSAGDFREAWRLRARAGSEVYYGHSYILDELGRMAQRFEDVGYLCCAAPFYDTRLPNGARVLGAGADPYRDPRPALAAMARFDPTHLIVHGPLPGLLNNPTVSLVANHGVNAARALVGLGVSSGKVLAWDFPHERSPLDSTPKQLSLGPRRRLLYAGSIVRSKGIGELIRAVARLTPALDIHLDIAGAGKVESYRRLARRLGVANRVTFLGLVSNASVRKRMRAADAVVVPSRHAFPEGLPLTLYEALTSRTPLIASDHPMFAGHLRDGESALIFPAGSVAGLADAISRLFDNATLYETLSRQSHLAWQRMQCPVKWGTLIERWVNNDPEDAGWLHAHTLAALAAPGTLP